MVKTRMFPKTTALLATALALNVPSFADEGVDFFEKKVRSLLAERCLECHSGAEASGKLDLTSVKGLWQGGDSGPVVAAGKPEESLLFRRIQGGEMPPAKQGKSQRLSREEVATVDDGAFRSGRVR